MEMERVPRGVTKKDSVYVEVTENDQTEGTAKPSIGVQVMKIMKPSHESKIVTNPGHLYVMGQGDAGQLGLGSDIEEATTPTLLELPTKGLVAQVVCGGLHTVALTSSGKVFTWGCNDENALGRNTSEEGAEYIPGAVEFPDNTFLKQVSAGDSHSAALSISGDVFAWGTFRDEQGPIGLVKPHVGEPAPVVIYRGSRAPCVQLLSGNNHLLMLLGNGSILSCGCGDDGQLGRVSRRTASGRGGRRGLALELKPEKVTIFNSGRKRSHSASLSAKVVKIFCGPQTSFALRCDGALFGWGFNSHHQLGSDTDEQVYYPILLTNVIKKCGKNASGEGLVVSSGTSHILVLNTTTNEFWAAGDSGFGKLGCGKVDSSESPGSDMRIVSFPLGVRLVECFCGDECSFATSSDKKLYSWGAGHNYQLGVGSGHDVEVPTLVEGDDFKTKKVISMSCRGLHTAILVE